MKEYVMDAKVKIILVSLIVASGEILAQAYPYGQKMISTIKSDGEIIETLVNECIEYCKIENPIIYEITDPKRCDLRGWIGYNNYFCSEKGKKETIMIRFKLKDRFGRERVDDKVCAWFGSEYKIKSTCLPNSMN